MPIQKSAQNSRSETKMQLASFYHRRFIKVVFFSQRFALTIPEGICEQLFPAGVRQPLGAGIPGTAAQ